MNDWILRRACKCQLLTGSYKGSTHSCSCHFAKDCKLSDSERDELYDDSTVEATREWNLKEFNKNG